MCSPALSLSAALAMLLALPLARPADAQQDYPNRPVRLIIPFPPGGFNDIVGRIAATQLSERMGKQFVVDNRSGAGGVIGAELAANAPGDGHTLLIASLGITINPWFHRLNYDPIKSFP